MTKLVCPECQKENEPERVYCHECGARLDRSALASRVAPKENIDQARRRVEKLFDPTAAKVRLWFVQGAKLVFGSCALAMLIQIIQPPDIPAPAKESLGMTQIAFDLENATEHRGASQLQYTEEQVNNHLYYTLKNKQSSLNKPFLDFRRCVVQFQEGLCVITVERSFLGFSIFTSAGYAVRVGEAKPVVSNKSGGLGRLPVHPLIMQFADIIFSDVWAALNREYKLVAKMGAIEFHDKSVLLTAPEPIQ